MIIRSSPPAADAWVATRPAQREESEHRCRRFSLSSLRKEAAADARAIHWGDSEHFIVAKSLRRKTETQIARQDTSMRYEI
mmetsp:Transcript_38778/g.79262  ORF Transcript_38778/g.79262 Transcript_38778/m.79262 type:complete len:81 (+) Transcript_38778:904-1146(+)